MARCESGWGGEPPALWGKLTLDRNGTTQEERIETIPGNYLRFYDNLFDAIRLGGSLAVKPEESAEVIGVIEAVMKSHAGRQSIRYS